MLEGRERWMSSRVGERPKRVGADCVLSVPDIGATITQLLGNRQSTLEPLVSLDRADVAPMFLISWAYRRKVGPN